MPAAVVAIGAAAAGAAASAAVAATLGAFGAALVGTLAATAVSMVGAAAFGLHKQPSLGDMSRDRTQMVREPIAARRTIYGEVKSSGIITFIHSSNRNRTLHMLLTLSGHPVEGFGDVYFNDQILPLDADGKATGDWAGYARVWFGDGTEEGDAALLGTLRAAAPEKWTVDHRQAGCAKLLIRLDWNQDLLAGGIPQVRVVVRGKRVYDPRTSQIAWSRNAALCLADYLVNPEGLGAHRDEIDWDYTEAAADVCDEPVPVLAGGFEPRYRCDGTWTADQEPKDVIRTMLTSMAGRVTWSGGRWKLMAGSFCAPTVTLDEDDLDGPITVQPRRSRRDLFNGVRATFINPNKGWQADDAPAYQSAYYVAEDNGEPIWADREFPFTTSCAAVQRLAKIELERNRQQVAVSYPCKLTALRVMAGSVVRVNNVRFGWVGKTFEVVDWQFAIRQDGDVPRLGIDLSLQEVDPNGGNYAWDVSEEKAQAPAASLDLPTPYDVAAPTNLVVTSQPFETADGTYVPGLTAAWTEADGPIVDYEVQVKRSSEVLYSESFSTTAIRTYLFPLTQGVPHDVRVRAKNNLGARSAWVEVTDVVPEGDETPPGVPTGVTATGGTYSATVNWTNPTDPDFRRADIYRHTSNNSAQAMKVREVYGLPGSAGSWSAGTPVGTYWYWVKAVDASGNESDFSVGASATVTDPYYD